MKVPQTIEPQLQPAQWPALQNVEIRQTFNGGFILTREDRNAAYPSQRPDAAFSDAAALVLYMLRQFGPETSAKVRDALIHDDEDLDAVFSMMGQR